MAETSQQAEKVAEKKRIIKDILIIHDLTWGVVAKALVDPVFLIVSTALLYKIRNQYIQNLLDMIVKNLEQKNETLLDYSEDDLKDLAEFEDDEDEDNKDVTGGGFSIPNIFTGHLLFPIGNKELEFRRKNPKLKKRIYQKGVHRRVVYALLAMFAVPQTRLFVTNIVGKAICLVQRTLNLDVFKKKRTCKANLFDLLRKRQRAQPMGSFNNEGEWKTNQSLNLAVHQFKHKMKQKKNNLQISRLVYLQTNKEKVEPWIVQETLNGYFDSLQQTQSPVPDNIENITDALEKNFHRAQHIWNCAQKQSLSQEDLNKLKNKITRALAGNQTDKNKVNEFCKTSNKI